MVMKLKTLGFLFLLIVSNAASAASDDVSEIMKLVEGNLKYSQEENVSAYMSRMHSQSPASMQTKNMLEQLFPVYELKYDLLEYNLVGVDGEYA